MTVAADYQSTAITGSAWTRAYQIVIDNRLGAVPNVVFHEERALLTDDGQTRHWASGQCALAYDPAQTIPVLDPATGAETGASLALGELYGLLYSAYIAAATARDAAGQHPLPE